MIGWKLYYNIQHLKQRSQVDKMWHEENKPKKIKWLYFKQCSVCVAAKTTNMSTQGNVCLWNLCYLRVLCIQSDVRGGFDRMDQLERELGAAGEVRGHVRFCCNPGQEEHLGFIFLTLGIKMINLHSVFLTCLQQWVAEVPTSTVWCLFTASVNWWLYFMNILRVERRIW